MRLNQQSNIPIDRNYARPFYNNMFVPLEGASMSAHYASYNIQHLKLKQFIEGYLYEKSVYISTPLVYRAVAGNLVRLFVYNDKDAQKINWPQIEGSLSKVFGQYQAPGTSGRARDDNVRTGRVKAKLDIIQLDSPLGNAEIMAQVACEMLKKRVGSTMIFDKVSKMIPGLKESKLPRRALQPGMTEMPVLGVRMRISGRPKGEEMASKSDLILGSCPKQDASALIDYGFSKVLLRSGVVGVKVWVHYQRPSMQDETNHLQSIKDVKAEAENSDLEDAQSVADNANVESSADSHRISTFPSLLYTDQDYSTDRVNLELKQRHERSQRLAQAQSGLFNVESAQDLLVQDLCDTLRDLHTPDNIKQSRYLW
ncbi:hypothetical protein MP228_001047 [Amoeboaphelidium protococcarum]|nr:hypothetical protein MP228_001047 [Amoeboaphelidium protococcarum]